MFEHQDLQMSGLKLNKYNMHGKFYPLVVVRHNFKLVNISIRLLGSMLTKKGYKLLKMDYFFFSSEVTIQLSALHVVHYIYNIMWRFANKFRLYCFLPIILDEIFC